MKIINIVSDYSPAQHSINEFLSISGSSLESHTTEQLLSHRHILITHIYMTRHQSRTQYLPTNY